MGVYSRRQLLRKAMIVTGGLAVAGPALSACGSGGGNGTVTFTSYGGSYQKAQTKAWLDPFSEANPDIKIVQDSPTDYAKLEAMFRSQNVKWDLIDTGADYGLGPTTKNLAKLDCEQMGCADLQPEKLKTTGYRIPVITYSNVLAYRTDKFGGKKPKSYADFFDLKNFPGKRSIANQANNGSSLEVALLADGVKIEDLYPLDVDRALKKLDTIKSELTYWETGEQSAQLLAEGQAVMGTSWNGRVYTYANEGAPVEILWNQHFLTADYVVIPKDAPNGDAAAKLAAYIVAPENSARISDHIAYGPPNVKAFDKINKKMRPYLPTNHLKTALSLDDEWWSKNLTKIEEKFQNWRSS